MLYEVITSALFTAISLSDSDPSHYYGVYQNQPSIQIENVINPTTDRSTVSGSVYITDQSEMGDDFDVVITDLNIYVEYRNVDNTWVRINTTNRSYDPVIPLVFNVSYNFV